MAPWPWNTLIRWLCTPWGLSPQTHVWMGTVGAPVFHIRCGRAGGPEQRWAVQEAGPALCWHP